MGKTDPVDKIILFFATAFYSGYSPKAPGTMGSLVGVLIFCLIHGSPYYVAITLAITLVGIPIAGRAEKLIGEKDARQIVIDEVAGQLIALYLVPLALVPVALGFGLFRLFDIWKPWPVGRMEKLPGGYGVMTDDVAAGIFALVFCRIILYSLHWG
jgi:phosphatidylglycerophosphatase A